MGEAVTTGARKAGDRRVLIALLASFALLFLAVVAAFVVSFEARTADRWVAHTIEMRRLNLTLFAAVQDAVLDERGYVITRDERLDQGLRRWKATTPGLLQRLRVLTADNPSQQTRLDRLDGLIRIEFDQLNQVMDLVRQDRGAEAAAVVRGHLTNNVLNGVRAMSNEVDGEELRLLDQRQVAADWQGRLLLATIVMSLICVAALALFVALSVRRNLEDLRGQNQALADEMRRREATEAQLRQAQKMEALGQLTGGVAHDFNNMLAVVVGNLDLLLKRMTDGDHPLRRHVVSALEGAQRGADLTQRLLAFARQQPLEPKPLDVNRCVTEVSHLLHKTLGEAVTIETVLAGGLWRANIDRPQLESAVLNLAINARDAMPEGGKLTVETANTYLDEAYASANAEVTPGQYVLIAVTDSGVGMPTETAAKAFDPFFTTKQPGRGTGLGLSQVNGFIKQSGGHVKLYSEVGVGTTVKLYLPRSISRLELDEESVRQEPTPARGAGLTVLVVEDEPGVRALAADSLKELGYRVVEAAGATEALKRLGEHPEISLMLTDVVMPEINGRQLAEAALRAHPELKVLYMTGYTRNAIVHNGVLDSDARLLVKPFTLAQLGQKVEAALGPREGVAS